MRTTKFQTVFDRIVRMLGRDPIADSPQDMQRAIVDHINERVETITQAWDWPEWTVTEERAYRPVYSDTTQYLRSNSDGVPDEIFYLGDGFISGGDFTDNYGYYRVIFDAPIDPPVGTLPTNDTYFELIDPLDRYIAYDQVGKPAIGRVTGAYVSDPRVNSTRYCGCGLGFKPSEKGIDIRGTSSPTVFLTYLKPTPVYTVVPFITPGKTYTLGDVVFYPVTNECYRVIAASTINVPTNATDWELVPFLSKWATFVVHGTFSDCLQEFDQGGNDDLQSKLALASAAEDKANKAFEARVDELTSQGQVLKYKFCRKGGWCESLPFTGGQVTLLDERITMGGDIRITA